MVLDFEKDYVGYKVKDRFGTDLGVVVEDEILSLFPKITRTIVVRDKNNNQKIIDFERLEHRDQGLIKKFLDYFTGRRFLEYTQ